MTSGDSDWPTKMFAAAPRLSTLVIPVTFWIAPPTQTPASIGDQIKQSAFGAPVWMRSEMTTTLTLPILSAAAGPIRLFLPKNSTS